jgi:hypothetical protein
MLKLNFFFKSTTMLYLNQKRIHIFRHLDVPMHIQRNSNIPMAAFDVTKNRDSSVSIVITQCPGTVDTFLSWQGG